MGRYICAWCGEYLNDIVFEDDKDSHVICKPCADELKKEFDKVKEYNNSVSKGTKQTIINKGGK